MTSMFLSLWEAGVPIFVILKSAARSVFSTASIWIAMAPVLLHVLDRLLEFIPPVSEHRLIELMAESPQSIVKRVGASTDNFAAVKAYFEFEERCRFIAATFGFSIISLFFSQTECTGDTMKFHVITFCGIFIIIWMSLRFLWCLANLRLHPAQANPRSTRFWELTAWTVFLSVLAVEVIFRLDESLCAQ
jgi:uncharacterized protein YjeT (DUF2065 family)